jgi:UDP-2,4-diacetamido-2,4,6-trideoxy-beta-L-altropyranose hydrolase
VATAAVLRRIGPFDALLIDHYGLDASWELEFDAPPTQRIVIDDLGDRPHECEVLIDPSIDATEPGATRGPAGHALLYLLGPNFAPLDPSYDRISPKPRDGLVHDLLVFLGGATTSSDLAPLLAALEDPAVGIERIVVLLGHSFPDRAAVHARAAGLPHLTVVDQATSMIPLLESADLAIGAPGGAQWERCAAGLPTLTVLTNPNQEGDCASFQASGATRHVGRLQDVSAAGWREALAAMSSDPEKLLEMGAAASRLVRGREQSWAAARATVASRLGASNGGAQ